MGEMAPSPPPAAAVLVRSKRQPASQAVVLTLLSTATSLPLAPPLKAKAPPAAGRVEAVAQHAGLRRRAGTGAAVLKFNLYSWAVILSLSILLNGLATIGVLKLAAASTKPCRKTPQQRRKQWQDQVTAGSRWVTASTGTGSTQLASALRFAASPTGLCYSTEYTAGYARKRRWLHGGACCIFSPPCRFHAIFEGVFRPFKYKLGLEVDYSQVTGGVFFKTPDGLGGFLWTPRLA